MPNGRVCQDDGRCEILRQLFKLGSGSLDGLNVVMSRTHGAERQSLIARKRGLYTVTVPPLPSIRVLCASARCTPSFLQQPGWCDGS